MIFSLKHMWPWMAIGVVIAALTAPNLLVVNLSSEADRLNYYETIVFGAAFWALWFALFKNISRALFWAIVPGLWWFASTYLRWVYHTAINSSFYGMLADTSLREMYEFSLVYGPQFFLGTLGVVGILVGSAVLARRQGMAWTHRSRVLVLVLVPLFAILLVWQFNINTGDAPVANSGKKELLLSPTVMQGVDKWSNIYPLDLLFAIDTYRKEAQAFAEVRAVAAQNPAINAVLDPSRSVSRVVLVIGESANAGRWSLYGFERDTTPKLRARKDLIILRDMVSPSTATRNSVPLFLSRKPVLKASLQGENEIEVQAQPTIVQTLGAMGYSTYWLSNQSTYGKHDSAISFYAQDAQQKRFINPVNFYESGTHDEALLPVLRTSLAGFDKKFIVLHTMGSHFHYAHRYPPEFEKFTPALTSSQLLDMGTPNQQNLVSNAYDNSTAYTDFVLDSIITTLEADNTPAILLYASDHGEDVYEPGCKRDGFIRSSKAAYRVPAFAWVNAAARARNPEAINRLHTRADLALTTRLFFDLIADLAGVQFGQTSSAPSQAAWASADWKPSKRWVGIDQARHVDFDLASQQNPCVILKVGTSAEKKKGDE